MKNLIIIYFALLSILSCVSTKKEKVTIPTATATATTTFNFGPTILMHFNGGIVSMNKKDTIPILKRDSYLAYEWSTLCGNFALVHFKRDSGIGYYSVLFENKGLNKEKNSYIFEEIKIPLANPLEWFYPQDMIKISKEKEFFNLMAENNQIDREVYFSINCKSQKWEILLSAK